MTTIVFNPLKLARKLEAAGFPPHQAADTAEALAESLGEVQGLATKEDLQDLELRLIKWIIGTVIGSVFASTIAILGVLTRLLP